MEIQPDCQIEKLSEVDWIQMAFPSEPDWQKVSDSTLIELVHEYFAEPSCATSALSELINRRHPKSEELCNFLLNAERVDKWLSEQALDLLLALNPIEGLNKAMGLLEDDGIDILENVIVALNYEQSGIFSKLIYDHPIIPLVKQRIARCGPDRVKSAEIFFAKFGTY